MDSRAKQRLTGAIILVALFVLLVPELLTGPRNADAPGTAAEEGMRRYTIDLNAANPSVPPVESPASAPVALPQPAGVEPRAQPGDVAEPAAAEHVAAAPAAAPAAAAPAPSAAPPAAVTPPAVTPAPAPRVEAPKPVQAAPAPTGSFAVQLGSFGSRDNADRLVRDMTAKGFAAYVATPIKSGGRELFRVRVGPTRDRAQAEALAAQLRRAGQSGSIVPIS